MATQEKDIYYVKKAALVNPVQVGFVSGFDRWFASVATDTLVNMRKGLNELEVHYAIVGDEQYRKVFVEKSDERKVRESGLKLVFNDQLDT